MKKTDVDALLQPFVGKPVALHLPIVSGVFIGILQPLDSPALVRVRGEGLRLAPSYGQIRDVILAEASEICQAYGGEAMIILYALSQDYMPEVPAALSEPVLPKDGQ